MIHVSGQQQQQRSELKKKVGGARSCNNFPMEFRQMVSCKFSTEKITGAQNFDFTPAF